MSKSLKASLLKPTKFLGYLRPACKLTDSHEPGHRGLTQLPFPIAGHQPGH